MNPNDNKSGIIKRILGRLPPNQREQNVQAVKDILQQDEIAQVSFDFTEINDQKSARSFIATPYTQSDSNEASFRSPFSQTFQPEETNEPIPLKDDPKFGKIEQTLNEIMQVYMKLYFGGGTGNFYSLDGEGDTLRGLFVLQSTGKEEKKIKNGSWKAFCPATCTVDADRKINTSLLYGNQCHFETESKYFGKITVSSTSERKLENETIEKSKYLDKDIYQVFVKHLGKALEDAECNLVHFFSDVCYSKIEDIICQCRQLKENNEFYAEKKNLIKNFFK